MKRKRLEATLLNDSGLAPDGGAWSLCFDDLTAHGKRYYSRKGRAAVRVVECDPDETVMPRAAAAVVRAAVRVSREHRGIFAALKQQTCRCDLCRAVERMQKGRRR